MKKIIIPVILLIITQLLFSQYAGTNIRGQVRYRSGSVFSNTKVELYQYNNTAGKWNLISQTFTNQQGFYFFYKIKPGKYYVQVNKTKNYSIDVSAIDYTKTQFLDIPVMYY